MKLKSIFTILFVLNIGGYAQVDNIPSDHRIYSFLKKMYVQGILTEYDDVILPLSRESVVSALLEIKKNQEAISENEKSYLNDQLKKFTSYINPEEQPIGIFDSFPEEFGNNLASYKEKYLFNHRDSNLNFSALPFADYKFIYRHEQSGNSSLMNLGGKVYGSYRDWFGFYLSASNGVVFNEREAALLDTRVKHSFTFNETGIDFFDNTEGYLKFQTEHLSLQLGRERILWGYGKTGRLFLSDNPPMFDFLRFNFSYKTLLYDFIHGWLNQKPEVYYVDSLIGSVKEKRPKYIAVSRLGFSPSSNFSMGISQMVIYSNRPFEAAYLNPFLFWESAQRSLNDLDNSFLSLDAKYLITPGLELTATIMLDDLELGNYFKGEWNDIQNKFAFSSGLMLTSPLIFRNLTLTAEYGLLRPYMFSHAGIGEALTATNNGFMLGMDLQPNSMFFSLTAEYRLFSRCNLTMQYSRTLHGDNYYDSKGNLIKNVGGNVFNSFSIYDSRNVPLLGGIVEEENTFMFSIDYELLYGLYIQGTYLFTSEKREKKLNKNNSGWISMILSFE
jgi:hypothetical protein